MHFLAISGSTRRVSTNTALLRAVAMAAAPEHSVTVWAELASLPIFSPDLEDQPLPTPVEHLAQLIAAADGLILSSPEYVHAIPGGLKNAVDWLVSRDELIDKPVALLHASHRGDDMLAQLRVVLATVSQRFAADIFRRFPLVKKAPEEIAEILAAPENRSMIKGYLHQFATACAS